MLLDWKKLLGKSGVTEFWMRHFFWANVRKGPFGLQGHIWTIFGHYDMIWLFSNIGHFWKMTLIKMNSFWENGHFWTLNSFVSGHFFRKWTSFYLYAFFFFKKMDIFWHWTLFSENGFFWTLNHFSKNGQYFKKWTFCSWTTMNIAKYCPSPTKLLTNKVHTKSYINYVRNCSI